MSTPTSCARLQNDSFVLKLTLFFFTEAQQVPVNKTKKNANVYFIILIAFNIIVSTFRFKTQFTIFLGIQHKSQPHID